MARSRDRDRSATLHRPARVWPVRPRAEPIPLTSPPSAPEPADGGLWMSVLPMVGSLSIVAFAFVVRSLVYLIVAAVMALTMIGAGLGARVVQVRGARRRWERTRDRWWRHLIEVENRAEAAAELQRAALDGLYPDVPRLLELVRRREGIWERRPDDEDFAWVRVGLGDVPSACPVLLDAAAGALSDPDPELAGEAERVVDRFSALRSAPVTLPLRDVGVVAVVGPREVARRLAGTWVLSLATAHAPGELRITGLVPPEAAAAWEWVKWLPHSRDPWAGDGPAVVTSAFTTDPRILAEQLAPLVASRTARARTPRAADPPRTASEHLVIIVDGYRPGGTTPAMREVEALMEDARGVGLSIVTLVDGDAQVPATCGARVDVDADGIAMERELGPAGMAVRVVSTDPLDLTVAEALARSLAPLRLGEGEPGAAQGGTVRLADLLDEEERAGRREPGWLTLAETRRRRAQLLRTPIGRSASGEAVRLDLKEAADGGAGPHGLVIGATGSGKSELLRSVVAGLAARHDPSLLTVLLVDFKGGAAFAGLAPLPHVAGLVTNLADEPSLVDRVRQALTGELERRQRLLREAGNLDTIGLYHDAVVAGVPLQPLPYLFVVVDEFGELLAAHPDFLDTFVALGRLGRSLGVHVLLASQRLDEGRIRGLEPHLRYRICLRTNTAMESSAVLGTPAAYELPSTPGAAYMLVDGGLTRFRAAIATLRCRPRARPEARLVRPFTLTAPPAAAEGAEIPGAQTDLEVLAGRLAEMADGRSAVPVWLDPLPALLALGDVSVTEDGDGEGASGEQLLTASIGLVDRPARQDQAPLVLDLSGGAGNVAIAGAPQTGKSTLMRTIALALASRHGPDRVQFSCIDLGGGGLFALRDLPHTGAVIGRGENEMIARLLREVRALVDERAEASRAHGATTLSAYRASAAARGEAPVSDVLLLVDGVAQLRSSMPDEDQLLAEIAATGLQYGVHVVIAANRWMDVRPALLDAVGTRLELRLGDPAESQVGRAAARTLPGDVPGRGLTRSGEQFQAAVPVEDRRSWPAGEAASVADLARRTRERQPEVHAPRITPLPDRLEPDAVGRLAAAAGSGPPDPERGFLLGVAEFRMRPVQMDLLARGAHLFVLGDGRSGRTTLLRRALAHLVERNAPERVRVHIIDVSRGLIDLADAPHVAAYAPSAAAAEHLAAELAAEMARRQPPDGLTLAQLRAGDWWSGPEHIVLVDDYDMLVTPLGGPLAALAAALPFAADTGLHVLLARRVSGFARTAFEPFAQRLRELGPTGLVLSGDPAEGPVLGGVVPRHQPPGRAHLVRPGTATLLVQLCWEPPGLPPWAHLEGSAGERPRLQEADSGAG